MLGIPLYNSDLLPGGVPWTTAHTITRNTPSTGLPPLSLVARTRRKFGVGGAVRAALPDVARRVLDVARRRGHIREAPELVDAGWLAPRVLGGVPDLKRQEELLSDIVKASGLPYQPRPLPSDLRDEAAARLVGAGLFGRALDDALRASIVFGIDPHVIDSRVLQKAVQAGGDFTQPIIPPHELGARLDALTSGSWAVDVAGRNPGIVPSGAASKDPWQSGAAIVVPDTKHGGLRMLGAYLNPAHGEPGRVGVEWTPSTPEQLMLNALIRRVVSGE